MSPIARLFTISGYILVLTQASSVSAEDAITPPPATTITTTPPFPTTLTCPQGDFDAVQRLPLLLLRQGRCYRLAMWNHQPRAHPQPCRAGQDFWAMWRSGLNWGHSVRKHGSVLLCHELLVWTVCANRSCEAVTTTPAPL
ncbi:hypothetical protein DFP72DRAFT_885855 [Ephemerocybe angulata]|uniref:Secreted protein n=1 Tax=Ephemerocybe angulata TaxID=980116 RepID=A0A8H6I5V2_9AGAR|nr:hypothetical protein DFP72DRAFT_885855 [Tulosesus angulatus]